MYLYLCEPFLACKKLLHMQFNLLCYKHQEDGVHSICFLFAEFFSDAI